MLALLFVKATTLTEVLYVLTGRNTYLLYVITPVAIIGMILSGGIKRTLSQKAAVFFLVFAGWMLLTAPFSSWLGGTLRATIYYYRDQLPLMFLLAGTVYTWRQYRTVVNCLALSTVVLIAFALYLSRGADEGRLSLISGLTIGNSNDLAAHLVLTIPFLLIVASRAGMNVIVRATALAFFGAGLYMIFMTASRGAFVALAAAATIYFFRASVHQRLIAAVLIGLAAIAIITVVPMQTMQRITAFGGNTEASTDAHQSSEVRKRLLRKSIEYSFRFPLFGLGMGQFSNYEGRERLELGINSRWFVTHNAYTQISSECGLPALGFFLAAIGGSFGLLHRAGQKARSVGRMEITSAADLIITAMGGFCVAVLFLSLGYMFYFPMFVGLAIAFHFATEREISEVLARRPAAAQR